MTQSKLQREGMTLAFLLGAVAHSLSHEYKLEFLLPSSWKKYMTSSKDFSAELLF